MNFIDYTWKPYDALTEEEEHQQASLLILTTCTHNDSVEGFKFVPISLMEKTRDKLIALYSLIDVNDIKEAVVQEAFHSARIEGSSTTLERAYEIIDGAYIDETHYKSEMMVKGIYNAMKYLEIRNYKINIELLLDAWNIIIDGCCENDSVRGTRFRTGDIIVSSHKALPYNQIEAAMEQWFEFYNSDELEDYPFVKAAVLHYVFEYIHPFCDGNGRLGRLLMSNYLLNRYLDKMKYVSVSSAIDTNLTSYYNAFQKSENRYSDITPFVIYMLHAFETAFMTAFNTMDQSKFPEELIKEAEETKTSLIDVFVKYESICPMFYNTIEFTSRALRGYKVRQTLQGVSYDG